MSEFRQNDESKRFLEVVDELIRLRLVSNVATFCRQIDYDPKSFSHIKTGKRNVPIEIIGKLYTIFAGTPIYIVSGQGSLLFDESESHSQRLEEPSAEYKNDSALKAENQRLNKLIDSMVNNAQVNVKYIKSLEETIKRLEAENEPSAKGRKVGK